MTPNKVVEKDRDWQHVWLHHQIKKMVLARGASIKQSENEMEMINSFRRREIEKKIWSKEKKLKVSKEERHPFSEIAR